MKIFDGRSAIHAPKAIWLSRRSSYNHSKQSSRVWWLPVLWQIGAEMSQSDRMRLRTSSKPALDLPPPFRLVTLREVGDAFAHATTVAAMEGAGTLVHVGRFDLAEFALV